MKTLMQDLGAALQAEILKTKRTLAFGLAFLAPVLVVWLEFMVFWNRGEQMAPGDGDIWKLLMKNCLLLWDLLMVPLFVTLQTALLGGLEHANKNWKHLFAQPVSRGSIYAAKQLVALGLIGLSTPVLWGAVILAGLALRALEPGIGFETVIPVWPILQYALLSFLASWLIVAIHTWIGMRWPSFLVAMSAGVAATIGAVIILQSDYNIYYPWTLPAALTGGALMDGHLQVGALVFGVVGGMVVAILGGMEFTRRDVL